MKLPSHLYLDSLDIPYEAKSFPSETEKGAANVANALGFPERQAVKTLIFQADTGERVLVMLGGDQNAVSGNLKKAIGSRNYSNGRAGSGQGYDRLRDWFDPAF